MCLFTSELRVRLAPRNWLNPPVKVFLLTVPRRCFFCGSFLLVMLHVGLCCVVVSVPCSLVVTCWERADLLAVVFVGFDTFNKCILVGRGWRRETGLSPPVKYFTDRSKAVLLLWIIYILCVCLFVPCGHLLGKG